MEKKNEEYSLLYDFYGVLLSERQREVFRLYYEENLSLSEIADDLGVSRQAVHISLRKAGGMLDDYEEKLGLIAKNEELEKIKNEAGSRIDSILKDKTRLEAADPEALKNLRRIKKLVKGIEL